MVELRRRFEEVGPVVDVFVIVKKDKQGKNFSFIRFEKGSDEEMLLGKMNRVWIGSYIIRASRPCF